MRFPMLSELPVPPSGRTGWPWAEEVPPFSAVMPDGSPWPRISIVTPSYNQGQFLEETIRSVLLQGYPNLEYIIVDGGSTDDSVEIIKKYEPWLAYWVSEKDNGQSHALNKGFQKSTGEIMAWINSDDYYLPMAFQNIILTMTQKKNDLWFAGPCNFIYPHDEVVTGWGRPKQELVRWFVGPLVMQPGVFWRKKIWEDTNCIDETLAYSFDYELWMQFVQFQSFPFWLEQCLANFRVHSVSKTFTSQSRFRLEDRVVYERYKHILSKKEKLRLMVLKREHKANKLIWNNKFSRAFIFYRVGAALLLAPWLLFRRSFFQRLKQLVSI